jgi:hypothetical protein
MIYSLSDLNPVAIKEYTKGELLLLDSLENTILNVSSLFQNIAK